jgi:acetyltransferase-like isoleucine patch superfamily enzyme
VLKSVTNEKHTVIGANSVVTKNFIMSVAVDIQAKVIKNLNKK